MPEVTASRIPFGRAHRLASTLIRDAARAASPLELVPVGGVRRTAPDVGSVSLLGVAPADRHARIIEQCARRPPASTVVDRQASAITVEASGTAATLRLAVPEHHGAALVWHTGSRTHTRKLQSHAARRGLVFDNGTINRPDGAPVPTPDEEDVYRLLDLQFVPPELREGLDEVDAAARGALPRLVAASDIKGDLHMHTTWSDGRDSIAAMIGAAHSAGYSYIAITDHSESALASRSLRRDQVAPQGREIAAVRARTPGLDVLWGIEVDILPDGTLDFDDHVLAGFDIVLASLHQPDGQTAEQLLDRYLRAAAHPLVNVITHPANRSPGYSSGYELDFDRLFTAAAQSGTAVEIDGAPGHLDLDGRLARRAVAAGATVVIDSDAHRTDALAEQMRFGVATARRGWVEPAHVLNTGDAAAVRQFVARKRGRR